MPIVFIGSSENSAASGVNVTLTLPGGTKMNDLVVVAYAVGDNDGVNFDMSMVTAGYTEVADLFSDDTQDANLGVFWKLMGSTPDTTAQVTGLGGTDASVAAVAMVFRGIDTITPMDVVATTATGIDTFVANPPSIDHNNPSGVWTVIAGCSAHTLGGSGTFTFPTGYTTDAIDRGQDDTTDITVGMAYRSSGVSDPEDPGVMIHSGADDTGFAWCAATLAIRPQLVPPFHSDAYRQIPWGAYHNDSEATSTFQRLIPTFAIAKYINEVQLSTAAPAAGQTFMIFPVRMDGIGHGGIFPGNRV